ncbi:hypothetical protein B0H10DRAFT_2245676 [Mycena sp. CBHHK59/15]|nr:hypothetical protein B0H10DRAFT_2245676 [Mycena sp. CBHHK59/15]
MADEQGLLGITAPWLRLETGTDQSSLSEMLVEAFPNAMTKDKAERYVAANVASCGDEVRAWKATNPSLDKRLDAFLADGTGQGPELRDFAAVHVAPVVACDYLFFALGGTGGRAPIDRDPKRPPTSAKLARDMEYLLNWRVLFEEGKATRDAAVARGKLKQSLVSATDEAKEYVGFITGVRKGGGESGKKSIRSIQHVAYALGFHLRGERGFGKDNAELEEYSLEDAKQRGAEMSPTVQETVRAECKQMSVAEFITPLWVAMATSILAVLHSRHNLSTKTWCQPGQMYQIWKAAGNRHRYEPSHPLTILERVLWKLVFRCALWELSPAGVVDTFYSDPEVVTVREMLGDDMSLHRNTLVWADSYQAPRTITGSFEDALASGALYTIDEDEEWLLWNLRSGGGARGGDLPHAMAEVAASEPVTAPIAGPSTADGAVTGAAPSTSTGDAAATNPDTSAEPTTVAPSALTPAASTSVTTFPGTTPNPAKTTAKAVEESGASEKSKTAEPADSAAAPAPATEMEPTKSGWRREARKKAEPIPLRITTRSRDPELANTPKTKPPVVVEVGSAAKRRSASKRKAVAKVAEVEEDDAGSNGFVHLFDAMSPLARVESDAERIEGLLKSGEQKKTSKGEQPPNKWELRLDEERPVMEECVEFDVFCPAANPNDPPVSRTHQWPVFKNTPNDRLVLQRMIDSQLKRDGQLLHLHISARDLDPDIRPSTTQSIVAVATKAAYEGLGAAQRHKLFRHRCVLVLDIGAEQPPAPFTPETLERYKNLEEDTDIQDCGLRTERDPGVGRIGKLRDLFNTTARGGRAILNALQNPQEYSQIPVPPGWPDFATHERAVAQTASVRERIGKTSAHPDGIGLPTLGLPWAHLRWVIIALLNAKSAAHQDVLTTVIQMITGWKLWAIGVPTRGEGKAGDFSSRHGFHGWQPHGSNTQFLRWEFILLGPNMCLYMRAGTIHYVISLENCIGVGHHGHCAAELSPGIWCALHNVVASGATTNADHAVARNLLVRVSIFQSLRLLKRSPGLHVPDLTVGEQLFDVVSLICYVIVYPALASEWYCAIEDGVMPMAEERFAELVYAWDLIHRLIVFIDKEAECEFYEGYDSFDEIIKVGAVHMAACLEQLGRSLAAFEQYRQGLDPFCFDLGDDRVSALRDAFEDGLESDAKFDFFVPWGPDSMPCTISITAPSSADCPLPPDPTSSPRAQSARPPAQKRPSSSSSSSLSSSLSSSSSSRSSSRSPRNASDTERVERMLEDGMEDVEMDYAVHGTKRGAPDADEAPKTKKARVG